MFDLTIAINLYNEFGLMLYIVCFALIQVLNNEMHSLCFTNYKKFAKSRYNIFAKRYVNSS